jgi:two-component system chemotaxis response regulator CheY
MTTTVTAKLRVLIVDDSRVMREMIARALGLSALPIASIDQAGDGAAALVAVRAKPYDLILLDLNMPVMDGEQFLATVRADPQLRRLLVVVCSTESHPTRIRRLRLLGAEFVHKPFKPEEITAAIVRATGSAPGAATGADGAPGAETEEDA